MKPGSYLRPVPYCEGDDDEAWKRGVIPADNGPRGTRRIPYRLWMRDPGSRAVLLFDLPTGCEPLTLFSRLMDIVRHETNGVRPWRVFTLVELPSESGFLLYEVHFKVDGEEYRADAVRLVKLKELTGIVGDESFKKGGAKP